MCIMNINIELSWIRIMNMNIKQQLICSKLVRNTILHRYCADIVWLTTGALSQLQFVVSSMKHWTPSETPSETY